MQWRREQTESGGWGGGEARQIIRNLHNPKKINKIKTKHKTSKGGGIPKTPKQNWT